jgi:hypothetical protein
VRKVLVVCFLAALLAAVGCGGSSSSSTNGNSSAAGGNTIAGLASNVAPVVVDAGPVASVNPQVNVAFTTVTVCVPNTANCQTIDHVAIDTGSTGLRLVGTQLTTVAPGSLSNVNGSSSPLAECIQFLDNSFLWGAVKYADVKIGGPSNNSEVASSVPIVVTEDASIPSVPSSCSTNTNTGLAGFDESTQGALGANGILGIGNFQYDCDFLPSGNACTSSAPPAMYYTCNGGNCSSSLAQLNQQLRNPVSLFTTTGDNNGVILELPTVPVGGQASTVQGSLVFGIGTQPNNGLGTAAVLTIDTNPNDLAYGGFTTGFSGNSYPGSFLDAGSNANYFLDEAESGVAACIIGNSAWYCPSSTQGLTTSNTGANGANHLVQFDVTSADTLFTNNNGTNVAFSDLAAPNSASAAAQPADQYFDWGLPFFYGRNVYTSINGVNSSGPFWAWLP